MIEWRLRLKFEIFYIIAAIIPFDWDINRLNFLLVFIQVQKKLNSGFRTRTIHYHIKCSVEYETIPCICYIAV